jgi:DNA-directed RNA polymerase subunit RPC12/RpoP
MRPVPRIKLNCSHCGVEFERLPSNIKGERNFCSRRCLDLGRVHAPPTGEDSPSWTNGSASYRSRALKAKGAKCEQCGYDAHEQLLFVHHNDGIPRGSPAVNHSLDNLKVLCIRCHREVHLASAG